MARGVAALGSGPEAGGPLSHAHARVHMCTCALQPAPLLGIFWGLHVPLRKMQSGVNWRGAVAQGCLMQALGWGRARWRAPSGQQWPCWAPGRVGIGAGLARAEGGLVEFGAGPPSGAEVEVAVWIWGLP